MTRQTYRLTISPTILALLATGIVTASPAVAQDRKVYPSRMCQNFSGAGSPLIEYSGMGLRNRSTTASVVVTCPIIKDTVEFSVAGANAAYLRYCKGTSFGLISSLYSFSAFGTSSYVNSKSDFSDAGCNKTLTHDPIASFILGYYSMVVVMPPSAAGAGTQTELFSYQLNEN